MLVLLDRPRPSRALTCHLDQAGGVVRRERLEPPEVEVAESRQEETVIDSARFAEDLVESETPEDRALGRPLRDRNQVFFSCREE